MLDLTRFVVATMRQSTAQADSDTAPGKQTNLSATPGGPEVTPTQRAPLSNGGSTITRCEHRHYLFTQPAIVLPSESLIVDEGDVTGSSYPVKPPWSPLRRRE